MWKKIVIGILAGIINGLFATGGGMILVPAFIYVLKMEDKESRATSAFCILPMVLTSSIFYYQSKYINWKIALLCAVGGAIGGYIRGKTFKENIKECLENNFCNIFNICII